MSATCGVAAGVKGGTGDNEGQQTGHSGRAAATPTAQPRNDLLRFSYLTRPESASVRKGEPMMVAATAGWERRVVPGAGV